MPMAGEEHTFGRSGLRLSIRCLGVYICVLQLDAARAQRAFQYPFCGGCAGWAREGAWVAAPELTNASVKIKGNSRFYLTKSGTATQWGEHSYIRFGSLERKTLRFSVDISKVDCGCIAAVYLVGMPEPSRGASNYCDGSRAFPHIDGHGHCVEVDLMEANKHAFSSTLHTHPYTGCTGTCNA